MGVLDHSQLLRFFNEVAALTINHDVISDQDVENSEYGIASVSPRALSEALAKVEPEWYRIYAPLREKDK